MIATIAEKKKSSAIISTDHIDHSDCGFHMIPMITELFFFKVIAAITAIVAIIWKPGLTSQGSPLRFLLWSQFVCKCRLINSHN